MGGVGPEGSPLPPKHKTLGLIFVDNLKQIYCNLKLIRLYFINVRKQQANRIILFNLRFKK